MKKTDPSSLILPVLEMAHERGKVSLEREAGRVMWQGGCEAWQDRCEARQVRGKAGEGQGRCGEQVEWNEVK